MNQKVKDIETLSGIVQELKKEGKKIVFTNGCFDIIHAGHVQYLRQAKALGDVLVVAVNSDSSVKSIKPKRPIMPQQHRAIVLSALEMVDYVTIFDEDTPYQVIKALQPDVLVKGGDWRVEDIVGSDIVKEVHSLPYLKGVSTTGIIEEIRKRYC
ncbi:MAG TPA: D-glycero-beta-D-manno-heptose 1-phosphate adenylyltransferase [Nitrospirae bacterium]|nr:D-glycero-beta-D-manno-heptose 1-phosphate adenylyltransferase [Nitrospirota bacterium]